MFDSNMSPSQQIWRGRGKEPTEMCKAESRKGCEHPQNLKKGQPEECSPEQIRECHGDVEEHQFGE